jgi:hypothetical protein
MTDRVAASDRHYARPRGAGRGRVALADGGRARGEQEGGEGGAPHSSSSSFFSFGRMTMRQYPWDLLFR